MTVSPPVPMAITTPLPTARPTRRTTMMPTVATPSMATVLVLTYPPRSGGFHRIRRRRSVGVARARLSLAAVIVVYAPVAIEPAFLRSRLLVSAFLGDRTVIVDGAEDELGEQDDERCGCHAGLTRQLCVMKALVYTRM